MLYAKRPNFTIFASIFQFYDSQHLKKKKKIKKKSPLNPCLRTPRTSPFSKTIFFRLPTLLPPLIPFFKKKIPAFPTFILVHSFQLYFRVDAYHLKKVPIFPPFSFRSSPINLLLLESLLFSSSLLLLATIFSGFPLWASLQFRPPSPTFHFGQACSSVLLSRAFLFGKVCSFASDSLQLRPSFSGFPLRDSLQFSFFLLLSTFGKPAVLSFVVLSFSGKSAVSSSFSGFPLRDSLQLRPSFSGFPLQDSLQSPPFSYFPLSASLQFCPLSCFPFLESLQFPSFLLLLSSSRKSAVSSFLLLLSTSGKFVVPFFLLLLSTFSNSVVFLITCLSTLGNFVVLSFLQLSTSRKSVAPFFLLVQFRKLRPSSSCNHSGIPQHPLNVIMS